MRNLSGCFLSDGLEICSSMFAQRADEVIRELVTFVDVAAYFADEAFFAIGFWLRFYIFLIVGVSHGVKIVHNAGFGDAADEHSMGTKVYILFNLQRHKCINIFVQEYQSIIRTVDLLTLSTLRPVWKPNCWNTENGASTDRQFTLRTPVCLITWWE